MSDHDELDSFLTEITRELKRPVRLDTSFDERVMAALEPSIIPIAAHRTRRPWYRRTISLSVSPLGAMAVAAALTGIVIVGALRLSNQPNTQYAVTPDRPLDLTPVSRVTGARADDVTYQQFIIMVPDAESVSLVGDFNDWDPSRTPMERASDDGAWSVTVPLSPGRYLFQYEVDGARRMSDPSRSQAPSEFGSPNSILVIEEKE